jgi:hypothetical protein
MTSVHEFEGGGGEDDIHIERCVWSCGQALLAGKCPEFGGSSQDIGGNAGNGEPGGKALKVLKTRGEVRA